MVDAIRFSWSETFPEERRRLNRLTSYSVPHSPPSGSFGRGMARVGFCPLRSAHLSPSARERLRRFFSTLPPPSSPTALSAPPSMTRTTTRCSAKRNPIGMQ